MAVPTFVGIGAQKCATTWLYDVLSEHPEILLGQHKEVNFFSYHFINGIQWYTEQFITNETKFKAIGEFSTTYFADFQAAQRISNIYPDIKLLLCLRDPVQRLISNHKHEVRIGQFSGPDLSIEAGIKNNPTYVEQGLYATQLEHWFKYFPKEQFHIMLFDDIKSDPQKVVYDLYEFLGVDPNLQTDLVNSKSNPSYVNRFDKVEKIRKKTYRFVKAVGLGWIWDAARQTGLQKAYRKANRKESESVIPPISSETRQRLKNMFVDEVITLEKLIDKNLDHWK